MAAQSSQQLSVKIYSHPACLTHSGGPGHPECPERLEAVLKGISAHLGALPVIDAPAANRAHIALAHSERLIEQVLDQPDTGLRMLDADTFMSPGSAQAALRACGAAVTAVDAVMHARNEQAFCATRPPGHHATADTAMGFCLFNPIAVAARYAVMEHRLERVAVLDFDVHHGNGTQDILCSDPRTRMFGTQQVPLYPGSGADSDCGGGYAMNRSLPPGSDGAAFKDAWESDLLSAVRQFNPQIILVSAGFDGHRLDPLADLNLVDGDFFWIGQKIRELSDQCCWGRVVAFLEGGYSPSALGSAVPAFLKGLGTQREISH